MKTLQARVPEALVRAVFASDQATNGQPVLPQESEPRRKLLDWTRRILVDYPSLDEHIRFLQELYQSPFCYARSRGDRSAGMSEKQPDDNRFRYTDCLADETIVAVADQGLDGFANPDTEIARLLMNPYALFDLHDALNELYPEAWYGVMHEVGRELVMRETGTEHFRPGPPVPKPEPRDLPVPSGLEVPPGKSQRRWQPWAIAAGLLVLLGTGSIFLVQQHNEVQRITAERDRLQAELDGKQPKPEEPRPNPKDPAVRWTIDPAHRPVGWQVVLDEHYDPTATPDENLEHLLLIGGNKLRAEVAALRQENPALTAKEILDKVFASWGPPKKR